jgi:hypothetical protein
MYRLGTRRKTQAAIHLAYKYLQSCALAAPTHKGQTQQTGADQQCGSHKPY